MEALMIWGDLLNNNLWALVIILPHDRCTLLMLQWRTQLPRGGSSNAATWQTVISARSTAMLWFPSPHPHSRRPHLKLCSLPPRTAPHGASTSTRCTPYKRWVSLPKLDSRSVPYQGRTVHWFPLCVFKAGTLTAGLKCQSSTLPARALRKSLDVAVGSPLYWQLLLQKEIPPCLLPSLQRWYLAAAFQPAFLSFLLISPLWRILHDLLGHAPACTGPTVPTLGANPKAPFHVSFRIIKISSAWPV